MLQRRLEHVGSVHGAARGRARADHRVNLVDEHDGVGIGLQLGDDGLQALLEIAAVACPRQQRAHVERVDRCRLQHVGNVALDDALGQALGDGGLADAGIADIKRVVLGPPAQHLDGALDLAVAPDQRIDPARLGLLVEVDAIGVERLGTLLDGSLLLVRAFHRLGLGLAGHLGDAVADVADGIEARHILLLEEIDRMALALGEQRDEHVAAGHLAAARGLDVHGGAMERALEARGGLGLDEAFDDETREIVVDEFLDLVTQGIDIDIACPHDRDGVIVLAQCQQEMFERGVLVLAFVGQRKGVTQCLFEIGRQHAVF